MTRPLVIAHRGHSARYPENTLEAYRAAITSGADLVETDARLSVDGVVIASHDLRVVKKLSHRIAVMYLGQIVEEGPTDPVYRQPMHPYTMALLAAIPDLSTSRTTRPVRLAGDPPSPANPPAGCHFHTRCPHARPRCSAEMPKLRPMGEGRSVRCHFAGELGVAS